MLYDNTAEKASPADRAVRRLPNTNAISSLVPTARAASEVATYLGQFDTEPACAAAALRADGFWAYAWHDPAQISGPFANGCYARHDETVRGSDKFPAQAGVMSAVFAPSASWLQQTAWDITGYVATQHRCEGAECEYFDPAANKSTMALTGLDSVAEAALHSNDPSSVSLRIYVVDFAMNVLPVSSFTSTVTATAGSPATAASTTTTTTTTTTITTTTTTASSSNTDGEGVVRTAYPGTLLLGQKPGYCDQDYDEGKCAPAAWLLNTMNGFDMPGRFAVNTKESKIYYWPVLASKDVSDIAVPASPTILQFSPSSASSASSAPATTATTPATTAPAAVVQHISLVGLTFAHGDRTPKEQGDAGGIQHDWARLQSRDALVRVTGGATDIAITSCAFRNSGGGGVRADGFAQRVAVTNSSFENLGYEAIGVYGLGLGLKQVTSHNRIAGNDITRTGLVKYDAPSLVVWNAAYTVLEENYVHDTSSRALYVGGSRYCAKPGGFATDGGINMNQWAELVDANIPQPWLAACANSSYAFTFAVDCKCSFFRGLHGTAVRRNVFARVTEKKDRPFFSDGLVYVSGPGYVEPGHEDRDLTVFEDNTWLASPGKGAPSFRMLYVDGYTGSMRIRRNAVVDGNAHQGFMLCNWYGRSQVEANALQLGPASWGSAYEISVNCDGNPVIASQANLVLSDESSPSHQPDPAFADQYAQVYDTVCAASVRAHAQASSADFLGGLSGVIEKLGGAAKTCDGRSRAVVVA
eukprot:g3427.t1